MRLASIEAVARALNQSGVPFMIVGGLAVNAHGYGRFTQDLDLVVKLEPGVLQGVFEALGRLGYCPSVPVTARDLGDANARARLIVEKGMTVLNFHSDDHRETPVDIFVTEPFDFEDEYERAMIEEVAPGVPVRIVRLETLIRLKREAGRPQDLADIAELEQLHGDMNDG